MNSETIMKEVAAIRLIAKAQAKLVRRANASSAHTSLVLDEIAERCDALDPPTRLYDLSKARDEQMDKLLEGSIGVVTANSYEQTALWREYHEKPDGKQMAWQQHSGVGETIGYLDDMPVHISLLPVSVDGHKIIFLDPTSAVVDHRMIDAWIAAVMPDTARDSSGRVNETNAMNFCNIFSDVRRKEREAAEV